MQRNYQKCNEVAKNKPLRIYCILPFLHAALRRFFQDASPKTAHNLKFKAKHKYILLHRLYNALQLV